MRPFKEYLIYNKSSIKEALGKLNELSRDAILFVIDSEERLIGSLTDGDVRRGLIKGLSIDDYIEKFIQDNPRCIKKGDRNIEKVIELRENNFQIIPIVDAQNKVVNVINFRETRSYLPIDAVVMAGGKGQRLLPLTEHTPKSLLKVGEKPIIEHNIDRLSLFGIDDFWISINYLGEQIEQYFNKSNLKNINISYVREKMPLGTIGAISNITDFKHDYVLITNSDLLTNVDYEQFFIDFLNQNADMAVLTIPYQVSIPYAVLETKNGEIKSFEEKPTYTYHSNGGVYLIKKEMLNIIPKQTFFDSTNLIEKAIKNNYKVISYPFFGYWLDIGRHQDFEKANIDIIKLKL